MPEETNPDALRALYDDGIRRSRQFWDRVPTEGLVPRSCEHCMTVFLIRAITRYHATDLLWTKEFYESAAILVRSIWEIALQAHYMADDPEPRARAFCEYPAKAEKYKQEHGKRMTKQWWGETSIAKLSDIVSEELTKRTKNTSDVKLFRAYYDTLYGCLSKCVHSAPDLVTDAIAAIDWETGRGPIVDPGLTEALRSTLPELATNATEYVMAAVARALGISDPPIDKIVWGVLA